MIGVVPSLDWSVADCKRFNEEHQRIFQLVRSQLSSQFVICHEQFDLIEDEESLEEFYRRGRPFVEEQIRLYTQGEDVFREAL